jgi:CBS domain containing-hemolysin-like protein
MSRAARTLAALLALAAPALAHASFLSGDALDAAANFVSWVVIVIVPVIAIAVFWYVHVLPEKIAKKRNHPQKDSIHVLCLLSLFFGGMLWPIAWLWAYTRPVAYRMAYGTDRHEDHYLDLAEKARAGALPLEEIHHLRAELAGIAVRGPVSPELKRAIEDLDALAHAPPVRAIAAATPQEA